MDGLITREYSVYTPSDLQPGEELPVVMLMHGAGDDRFEMATSVWRDAVASRRFVAVFPQGLGNAWNVGGVCCTPSTGVNDLWFVNQLWTTLLARPDVNETRSYMGGFSNGSMFSYWYSCQGAHNPVKFATMGAANLITSCVNDDPVDWLAFHGTADEVLNYYGNATLATIFMGITPPHVPNRTRAWANTNGDCAGVATVAPTVTLSAKANRVVYTCGTITTTFDTIVGATHLIPNNVNYNGVDRVLTHFDIPAAP